MYGLLARQVIVLIELHIINLRLYASAGKKSVVELCDCFFCIYNQQTSDIYLKLAETYTELHTEA